MKKWLNALEQGELARGLGLLEQGELERGSGHRLHLETPFPPSQARKEGRKGKNKKLKRTKTEHPQRLLFHFISFHFMLVLFCYFI